MIESKIVTYLIEQLVNPAGSGSLTGAVVALLMVKRYLAGIELIIPLMKKPCSGLRTLLVDSKSQIFENPRSAKSLRFLINAEKLIIPNNFICNFVQRNLPLLSWTGITLGSSSSSLKNKIHINLKGETNSFMRYCKTVREFSIKIDNTHTKKNHAYIVQIDKYIAKLTHYSNTVTKYVNNNDFTLNFTIIMKFIL